MTNIKKEEYSLSKHNITWKKSYSNEKLKLQNLLPQEVIGTIQHIGSTAIIGIKAKPIVDILMEVSTQYEAKTILGPILEKEGYTHIIHKGLISDEPTESSWFIKRNNKGERTHHIRCAEADTSIRNRVLFVRYLNSHPQVAQEYELLKCTLLDKYPGERRKYLSGKGEFIKKVTEKAIKKYGEYLFE